MNKQIKELNKLRKALDEVVENYLDDNSQDLTLNLSAGSKRIELELNADLYEDLLGLIDNQIEEENSLLVETP